MSRHASTFLRFLHDVRRRLLLIRLLESIGIATAISAAAALMLALALLWRGREAMQLCAATLALGAVAGLIAALVRRPTLFDAACEADRQLQLSDLLATALTAGDARDPWQATVLGLASERCRALSPAKVIVHRLGGRAWGGIGLSVGLVLCIGALSLTNSSHETRAADDAFARGETDVEVTPRPQPFEPAQRPGDAPRSDAVAQSRIERDDPRQEQDRVSRAEGSDAQPSRQGAADGVGRGETDRAAEGSQVDLHTAARPESGTTQSGGGRATRQHEDGAPTAGARVGTSPASDEASPWLGESWSRAREDAQRAMRQGKVPDATRDVVREYFRADD